MSRESRTVSLRIEARVSAPAGVSDPEATEAVRAAVAEAYWQVAHTALWRGVELASWTVDTDEGET
jgi:hypothetical protein